MTVDIATLGIKVDATQVDQGAAALDKLTAGGAKAEAASQKVAAAQAVLAGEAGKANASLLGLLRSIEQSTSELVALGRAQTSAATAATGAARATDSATAASVKYTASFTPLKASISSATQALGGFSGQAATASAAAATAGAATKAAVTHFDSLYDAAQQDFAGAYVRGAKAFVDQTGKVGESVKLTGMQMAELGHIVRSLAGSITAGTSPFQALTLEASRMQYFLSSGQGGVGGTVKALIGLFTPFRLALAGVALVLGAAAMTALDHAKALAALEDAAVGAGRSAGTSAGAMDALAHATAGAAGISVGAARDMELAFARTGKISAQVFGDLIKDQRAYALATGQSSKEATAALANAFADPAKGAQTLNEQIGALTASEYREVEALAQAGRAHEAQIRLVQALNESLKDSPKYTNLASYAWEQFKAKAGDAKDAVGGFIGSALSGLANLNPVLGLIVQDLQHMNNELKTSAQQAASLQALHAQINQAAVSGEQIAAQVSPTEQKRQIGITRQTLGIAQLADLQNGDVEAANRATDAIDRETNAYNSFISAQERSHKLAELDAQAASARSPAAKAAIAAKRAEVEASGEAITAAEKEQRIADASAVSLAQSVAALNDEARAIRADTAAALGLAEAYGKSATEGLKAEAARKAADRAARGDISFAEAYRRQLQADLADQVASGAKAAEQAQAQADAESHAADAIQIRGAAAAVANQQMKDELTLRPLVIAKTVAQEAVTRAGAAATEEQIRTLRDATQALEDHRKALEDDAAEQLRIANLTSAQQNRDQIAGLELEGRLLAANNVERAKALALLAAEQEQRAKGYDPGNATLKQQQAHDDAVSTAVAAAEATANLQAAQDAYNGSLGHTADLLSEVADHVGRMTQGLSDGLGAAGKTIADLLTGFTSYRAYLAQLDRDQAEARKRVQVSDKATEAEKAASVKRLAEIDQEYQQKRQDAEAETNVAAIDSFKQMFDQKSGAYKALTALETAYQAIVLAGHIQQMASEATLTAKSIAFTILRTGKKAVEAVVNAYASLPFPLNLAAGAATIAAIAALGVSIFGGRGGGSSVESAADVQKRAGTGTVLGDVNAKSDSIQKALDQVAKNTNRDLEFFDPMLKALKSIDNQIGVVASAIAKSLNAGGALDASKLNLGTTVQGPGLLTKLLSPLSLILPGLFGSSKTTTLLDQGLTFDPQRLADLIANGIAGATYQATQTETKKKFFGITYSDKTSTNTATQALDADLSRQLTALVSSLRDGVLSAANALGVDGAQAVLDAFQVNIGKISFKDLTGDQIRQQLDAVFSKLGDTMSEAILPAITQFQKVGEGAFETLVRVAREYQVVDVSLTSIGKTFGEVGVASIAAREHLVGLFDSLDDFQSKTQFFADNFLSESERIAPIQKAVQDEFARLGVTGVNTVDQFKQLVLGLDLTTQSGQDMYEALLNLAPAFAKVDAYLNPDAANAASDAWRSVFQNLQDWIRALNGEITSSVQSTAQAYAALQSAALAARGGDVKAAGQIVDLGNAYLTALRASAGSEFEYLQGLAKARAIGSSVELYAQSSAGLTPTQGSATPFSPATSATGSTAPSYTYTAPTASPTPTTTTVAPTYPTAYQLDNIQPTWGGGLYSTVAQFATGGSFTVGGSGMGDSQNFGPVNLSPGEVVNVSRRETMAEMVAANKALKAELESLRADLRAGFTKLASNTSRSAKVLETWDGAGLPPSRDAEEAA